jgi:hypothetical protein
MTELLEFDSGGVHHEVLADLADDAAMYVVEALAEREQELLASLCVRHEFGDGRDGVLFDFLDPAAGNRAEALRVYAGWARAHGRPPTIADARVDPGLPGPYDLPAALRLLERRAARRRADTAARGAPMTHVFMMGMSPRGPEII